MARTRLRIRHTVDVWAAQADPGPTPAFTPFRLSQVPLGGVPGAQTIQQLEFNPPNLPIFRAGSSPFMGDYLDVAPEIPFVRNGSTWSFNTAPTASPVFHGIWTDNRDIRPPVNGLWTDYTPPNPPFARPAMSAFDPAQAIPACVPGQAGMRNQNIYTARITRGLVVGALGNSRRLGAMQRSFPVFAQNNSTMIRTFRLTITNQPVGGQASFQQFAPLTTLDVRVPRKSTVARTVFARSSDPHAQINVSVVEIAAPGGAPVPNGQQGTIVLNPDPTTPDLENPDLENPDLENPDLENAEVHNPDLENATVRNPDLENPDLENPDLENPDLENTTVVNTSILNPNLENPDLENPDLENPDLENPDLENVDLTNGALSDTTWTVTNKGNTAGAYTVRLALNRQLPAGFKSQLLAHKIYQTPATLGCSLLKQSQTVLLANIPNPRFVATGELANPDLENPDLENLTIAIAPGETARITLRVFDPIKTDAITFRAAESVTPVAVAQAVNTPEADQGITQPAAAGVLTSSAPVPGGTSGGGYATTLTASLPGTWTVAGGTVPPGLTVDPTTGAVTGTPTTPGAYTFTARFQSTIGIIDYQTVTITVGAVGAAADIAVAAVAPTAPVSIGTPFPYTLTVSNAGPAAATTVRLTDTLPEGTAFVSATTTIGTCQHVNGTLVCTLGTLASGGSATIVLTVRPTISGTHTNTAVVTASEADPVATNNSAVSTASTLVSVTPCTTVCFSGPTSYIAGPNSDDFGAEKGDFNGDGFVDLIFGPVGVNTVGIMLANGAGGFGPPSLIPIPGTPNGAAVADFNNDGHQDVVISSELTAEAWVLIGNGLGQFGAPGIVTLPNTPQNVVAADFNRDGNVDVALAGDAGPLVMILRGNGNGTFQPATTIGTTTTYSTVATDDVNNDTNPDLVVHQEEVGLVIIFGNGAAGFQPPTTLPITDISGIIKTGDLTGDGFADLILGSVPPTGAELHLYVGDGLGGFTQSVMIGDPALTDGAPAVGDLDSDGDLDVVWGRSGGGIAIQLNNGSGTFAAPIYLASPQVGQILVADYNGDGRPDLALPIGDAPQSQFLVFLNTCDQPPAELAVTLSGPTDSVAEGSPYTYNIEVTNSGPNPATGVQLDFVFAPTAEFVAIGGSPASCSVIGNRVTCQLGTLAIGAVSAFAIDVLPRSGGTLQSTAGVTATTSDPNPGNNAAFLETTVTSGASTLVVTNTNESGPGSLFQAIIEANDPGPRDTITFNIPGGGPHTIRPTTRNLPNIDQPVVIDATTQPGYAGTPLIEISGENAGVVNGLVIAGGNSIVRGLAINRFPVSGIFVASPGNVFEGNYIGTNTAGTAAAPNGDDGIKVRASGNTIGGTSPGAGNLISGNLNDGVDLGPGATNTLVQGNRVGTNAAGTAAIGNGRGVNIVGGASNTTVGGTAAGARNILSGNSGYGVRIADAGTSGNRVLGNFVGTNAAGTAAVPNGLSGVFAIDGASGNTIGGTQPAEGNVISGNASFGVAFFGAATDAGGNTVLNNFIGTDATGTAAIGNNASGVFIETSNNRIGSLTAGVGNTIAFNGAVGVRVGAGTGNAIVNNRIFSNGSLGIDLAPLGVTANDAGDTDTGPNNLLNRPVLSSARTAGTNVLVQVALSPTPSGPGQIQFFANTACDASGSGEGQTFLGASSFGVNPGGDTNFEASFSAANVPAGSFLTATATDSGNNTSEFSACAQVAADAGTANLSISKQDSPDPVTVGSQLTYLISVTNLGPNASSNATVTDVLPAGVTLVSATASAGACSGTTTVSCALGSIANGSLVTVSIAVVPTAAGPLTNTATVSASGTDPDTSNNSATTTTTVVAAGPQTFVVTNTSDSGAGSLRQAILDANARVGPDTITFAIPGAGVRTITLASLLPAITDPVTIDGTTQPGFGGTPIVELNGNGLGGNGLGVSAGNTTIRGLAINRFAQGISLVTSGGNIIEGNYIGTDTTGTIARPNSTAGILIGSANNRIGGSSPGSGNLISGNGSNGGILISGAGASNNIIQGNRIGTNAAGTAAVPNGFHGVSISSAPNNQIGGTAPGAGNLVSGNAQNGIAIFFSEAANTRIEGNRVGTNAAGTAAIPNLLDGIGTNLGVPNTIVGGAAAGAGNLVSGNARFGVGIFSASGTLIQGNLIGTDFTGTIALQNTNTGAALFNAVNSIVGGTLVGEGNTIRFNGGAGVSVPTANPVSTGNRILRNAISGNAQLGIDIGATGVTPNDVGDADSGANNLQNFPVLTSVSGGVQATLNSTANGTFRIEFFGNAACDASGNGEGATFLGSASLTTAANGNATIPFFAAVAQFVTATATDASGNTSEFSPCVGVTTLAQHLGAANPTTEGFTQAGGVSAPAPVVNDGGFDAWRLTGSGGTGYYGHTVNYAPGFVQGWRLTARMRVVSGTGWAYFGLLTSTDRPRFDVGVRTVGADTEVGLFDSNTTTSLAYTIPGAANNWFFLELVYDPATALATLFVNGVERLTGYPGFGAFRSGVGLNFGAQGATANFNLVKFEIPATPANPTSPTTSYAAWRAGAPAGLTTVDFEAFSTGTILTGTEYAPLGLTLTQRDGDPMRVVAAGDGSFVSAANLRSPTHGVSSSGVPGFPFGYNDTRSENYDFTFTNPQASVGLWIGNLNPGFNTVTVQFLDDNGAVIGTLPLTTLDTNLVIGSAGQFDNRLFVGINSSTPIKRIRVVHPDGDAEGIVIDDVVWGEAASNPTPTLTSLSPASATVGGAGFTLTVNGSDFVPGAGVSWNGGTRATSFVNSGQLLATIPASDLAATGTATITVSNPAPGGGTSNGLPFAILPAPLQLTATDADAAELGSNLATFTVSRSGGTTLARDVSISVGGSASNNTDYSISSAALLGPATGGTFDIRIPAGQASATITITPIFSPEVEGSETVILTAEGSSATATIADEPAVSLVATDATAAELGPNLATFVLTRNGASTYDRDVRLIVGGTASNNLDYTIASPALLGPATGGLFDIRIPAGQTSATITITPVFNDAVEPSETVTLTAEGSLATVTILDEPAVTLVATDSTAAELGLNVATFVVSRNGASTYDRDVRLIVGGTATNNLDYTIASPALLGPATGGLFDIRIPAGQTSATITITPVADGVTEGSETVILTAEGAAATATIVDQFASVTFTVTTTADSGPGSLRQAILDANASPGNDLITFAIPGAGVHTISPLESPLPPITGTATIDGTSQPGYSGLPVVELNGTSAGPTANGLVITGNSTTVRALAINRFGPGGQAGDPGGSGIVIQGAGSHRLQMLFIGTNAAGTAGLPNRGDGIVVDNSPNNLIGGESPFANVISGNGRAGILLTGTGTLGTNIVSNFIGTNRDGTVSIGNPYGVRIEGAPSNSIGGTFGEPNVISGNSTAGIAISGNTAQSNTIGPNFIGTNSIGSPLGNGDGVAVGEGASNNFIGHATVMSQANVIRFNAQVGVRIESGTQNAIRNNRISDNGLLGIDLEGDGITLNDAGDPDTGANNRQNFPVLEAASGGVLGTFNSVSNSTYRIEFFGHAVCDASGHGEGGTVLGTISVATDGAGNATIPLFTAASGQSVTATATDSFNNTSEFSACVTPLGGTRTWISNTSGTWEDPANWSGGIVPQTGEIVVIDRPSVSIAVTVESASVNLASLQSQESLVMNGGAISVDGAVSLGGGLIMSGGSLASFGELTLGGASLWTGGNINGPGLMTVQTGATLTVSSPGVPGLLARGISNHGLLIWNQSQLSLLNGAQILNQPGGVFEVQSNLEIVNATSLDPLTLTNQGLMLKSGPGGAITLIGVAFSTTGTLLLRLGPVSDEIFSTEAGSLGGTLNVALQSGFVPTQGAQFDILSFASRTGTFAVVNGGGQTYTPSYTPTGVTLTVGGGGSADVTLTKVGAPDPATVNAALLYALTVTNNGPGTATSVSVTDTLPAGVSFVSATPSQGSCSGITTVTCDLGAITNSGSATVLIVVTPTLVGPISNTASVTTTSDDPVAANNTSTAITNVVNASLTFVVTNTNPAGSGSFRQALLDANANVSAQDAILFSIPGPGPHTIRPAAALPTIVDPVAIYGTSQPGYVDHPVIELDGTNAGDTSNGLFFTAGSSVVFGLSITRFGTGGLPADAGGAGIVVFQGAGSNIFESNYLGLDPNGVAQPNRSDGIFIDRSPNNHIGGFSGAGNVVSGNARNGITLSGLQTTGTLVVGNFIGTLGNGNTDRGNGADGVAIFDAPSNFIGITEGNVISGNGLAGVTISGANARFNAISGNVIGADVGSDRAHPEWHVGRRHPGRRQRQPRGSPRHAGGQRHRLQHAVGGPCPLGHEQRVARELDFPEWPARHRHRRRRRDCQRRRRCGHGREQPAELPGAHRRRGWRADGAQQHTKHARPDRVLREPGLRCLRPR